MAPLQVPNGSFSQFGPIWRPMALPYGHSGPGKWSQHITLDVPSPDPTLIHTDPPVCSRQGGVWPQKDHLWLFWAVFGHKMGQNGSKWLDQEWLPLDHDQTQPHWAYSIIGFHKIATSLSPPPLNTLWGAIRHHSQKNTIPDDCENILDFFAPRGLSLAWADTSPCRGIYVRIIKFDQGFPLQYTISQV